MNTVCKKFSILYLDFKPGSGSDLIFITGSDQNTWIRNPCFYAVEGGKFHDICGMEGNTQESRHTFLQIKEIKD